MQFDTRHAILESLAKPSLMVSRVGVPNTVTPVDEEACSENPLWSQ